MTDGAQAELQREGAEAVGQAEVIGRTPWQLFWLRFRRDRVALASLGFIAFLIRVAIFAGVITRAFAHPPNAQYPSALNPQFGTPTGPSSTFLFGVDVPVRRRRGGPRRLLARDEMGPTLIMVAHDLAVAAGGR